MLICKLGLCGEVEVVLLGCLSRERERSREVKRWIRRCCGGEGVGRYMGVKGVVERKLLAAEGGKLAVGSIR